MPSPLRSRPADAGLLPRRTVGEACALLGAEAPAGAERPVTGVTLDSRAVRPGDLYAALPGARVHGARFAGDALAAGAVAVLTDPEGAALAGPGAPLVVVPDPRGRLGALAAWVYGEPAAALRTVGITGTNGKTTTAYLVEAALGGAGLTTGVVGTVETRVGDRVLPSARTTPEAPDLQALLAVMREERVDALAMEVSSHALVLGRVDGVVYDVAVFTNLSQDHLDFHASMEDYFAAKASLFTPARCRRAVVDVDDPYGARLAAQARVPVATVSPSGDPRAQWRVVDARPGARTAFRLLGPDGAELALEAPLPGAFNVANTALAAVAALALGADPKGVAAGLAASRGVPGRMERVDGPQGGPLAVVDYAHTPDAVAAALSALRPVVPGTLAVVLGAGGDRDRGKRGPMGAAAAQHADLVVVTDDNPRSEDPAAVRAAVLAGARATGRAQVEEVADRRAAVRRALRGLRSGDGVLVAGKGHEQGQEVAGVVTPFDDRAVLREELATAVAGAAR
ncbi:UDP-N-acetylmuramoyl-L-alanyl-D-glutamate--2,6-diaminopimelate ligase [Vallicoccus soli]|uniref:UDP-N-acetylmuramoyl-L-alanyl-D-glutamate--2,6-diaminopimelate ligase n=1 Tax=Vallicoccus soli TaxID=2339232 RepID=A0A3A3Z263_9ACTN|nr:UDP-N-acetylmuramoyl-L-alanyl-D-glutamate--2,6-diaminopimelate ligase [Vallicoccus soli]RJK96824.1 UDP-N-acetylmuramoyl-L-alanyl-D-glutamate--2,6-diaminopimelate ligase [Vallicoccus soli]